MKFKVIISFFILVIFFCILAFSYVSLDDKRIGDQELEQAIKTVIKNNPAIIVESLQAWQEEEMRSAMDKAQHAAADKYSTIIVNKDLPRIGDDNAPIKVVEFIDYSCGYCKLMHTIITPYIANRDVQLIVIELPILGERSFNLARAALAVFLSDPEQYSAKHSQFLQEKGWDVSTTLDDIKTDNKLNELFNSQKVENLIKNNIMLANEIGISATPAYIINGQLYSGAINSNDFANIVNQLKK